MRGFLGGGEFVVTGFRSYIFFPGTVYRSLLTMLVQRVGKGGVVRVGVCVYWY